MDPKIPLITLQEWKSIIERNVCVTGRSETYNVNGVLIGQTYTTVKYNNNGVQKWVKTFGTISEQARAIAIDSEGNIYVTGI